MIEKFKDLFGDHTPPIVVYIRPDKWWKSSKWGLMEDYTGYTGFTVPAGYITDGASVPRFLQNIFSPTGKLFEPSIIHDYIISELKDWDKANEIFAKELEYYDMGIRKNIVVYSVIFYSKNKKYLNKFIL